MTSGNTTIARTVGIAVKQTSWQRTANLKLDFPFIGDHYVVRRMAYDRVVYAESGNSYTGLSPSGY